MRGLTTYCNEVLKSYAGGGKRKFLPIDACATKVVCTNVTGMFPLTLSYEDKSLNEALKILGHSLLGIYRTYGRHYMFFEPMLLLKENASEMILQVGLMEKSRWRQIEKIRKEKGA